MCWTFSCSLTFTAYLSLTISVTISYIKNLDTCQSVFIGVQGDDEIVSYYLWLAKWFSLCCSCHTCHPVMVAAIQDQSSHWRESSACSVHLWHAGNSTTIPPGHGSPCAAQAVGKRNPIFEGRSACFLAETLFHSHAATICKFVIMSQHGELIPTPNQNQTIATLKGNNSESSVWMCFWFCFKPAITPNSTVQQLPDMVETVL